CTALSHSTFFLQTEDTIRVDLVTEVQTSALPISRPPKATASPHHSPSLLRSIRPPGQQPSRAAPRRRSPAEDARAAQSLASTLRSEERRVGNERTCHRCSEDCRCSACWMGTGADG